MYGWKGRIGPLLPHRNMTIEPEFQKMCAEGVSIHAARMVLKELTPDALMEMEEEIYKERDTVVCSRARRISGVVPIRTRSFDFLNTRRGRDG